MSAKLKNPRLFTKIKFHAGLERKVAASKFYFFDTATIHCRFKTGCLLPELALPDKFVGFAGSGLDDVEIFGKSFQI